jgi:hypothetical protein
MEVMENYFNLRRRHEGYNGSSRMVIGADYSLPDIFGNGVLGYTLPEARDAILSMLDHQAQRVRIKSEPGIFEMNFMEYEPLGFRELSEFRASLGEKRPDIQFD